MACTKETLSVADTTALNVANFFRDIFINAGLMTDWYDSFTSGGIENRILEVTYDSSKTFGKTYYWFMFKSPGIYNNGLVSYQLASNWDAVNHVPLGDQYLDFLNSSTSSEYYQWQFITYSTGAGMFCTTYKSALNPNLFWFVLTWGTTSRLTFTIINDQHTLQPWINLDKGFFNGHFSSSPSTSGTSGLLTWKTGPSLRRDIIAGPSLVGHTDRNRYNGNARFNTIMYSAPGHASTSDLNFYGSSGLALPVGFSSSNPAYTEDASPVFHSMPYLPYITDSGNPDFGLTFYYATNQFAVGDRFIVSPDVEEWEVLDYSQSSYPVNGASPLFLARMV